MLSKERVKELKDLLATELGETNYIPELYLLQEIIPQLAIVFIINAKKYTFTIPLYLFENNYDIEVYRRVQTDLINEIKRNVKLAHKREELIR